jgi:lysophospholipase L1-like esterase
MTSCGRLRTVALVVAGAAAFAAIGVVGPAAAATGRSAAPLTRGSLYLALGDSVTFGYQEPNVVPAPNYRNASSFLGYPEHLGAELHLRIINTACPGETSASLIDPSAPSNGCENSPPPGPNASYRKSFPLHVRYKGAQLAYAVAFLRAHRNVRLVSLMIGANDLFLCQETTRDACASNAERRATLTKVAANVRRMLTAIRGRAQYRGQLAIVNYYSLNYASSAINVISLALNNAVDGAAKPFHVVIADGYGELKTATRRFGGSACGAGLITQLGTPGKCGVHPTYAGQALLAEALEKVIRL